MGIEQRDEHDPAIQGAVAELQGMIRDRWPQADFELSRGDDPEGSYLDAIVDIEDPDEVMDLVVDRLLGMQVDQGLPVHVVPRRPVKRALEMTRARVQARPYSKHRAELDLEPTRTTPPRESGR